MWPHSEEGQKNWEPPQICLQDPDVRPQFKGPKLWSLIRTYQGCLGFSLTLSGDQTIIRIVLDLFLRDKSILWLILFPSSMRFLGKFPFLWSLLFQ